LRAKGRPRRRGAKPAETKVEAKRPIVGKLWQSEGSTVHDLENRLAEALKREAEAVEQQTATAEILRVMSSSLAQLQPVLDAIAERAARLCDAANGTIILSDGEALRMEAHYGPLAEQIGITLPIDRRSVSGRAFIEGRPLHVDNLSEAADFPLGRQIAAHFGVRTFLAVPLVREAMPIGLITMQRTETRPFSDKQIELLKTFADQAVIAIENVRLFKALEAKNADLSTALDQQTATSEILRVISASPTDVQPTFDAIAASAIRLCAAEEGTVFRFDGTLIHLAAHCGVVQNDLVSRVFPRPAGPGSVTARAIQARSVVHVPDVRLDSDLEQSVLITLGFRTVLSVPILRDGDPIGAITVSRQRVAPFSDAQIALLQTFADQAVIAIENVRLFNELQDKTRVAREAHAEVSQALVRETANSEILRVIGSSPTNAQPVFETIARSGVSVCAALGCVVFVVDGDMLHVAATHGVRAERLERFERDYPIPLSADIDTARTVRDRRLVHLADIERNPHATASDVEHARLAGYRTRLMVPMVRGGRALGLIAVTREAPTPFSDQQVDLLKTFADQAVIAIDNVRLFNELQSSNRALTTALDQQTASSEVLRIIASSPTNLQPVFDAIVRSAGRLCDSAFGALQLFDGEQITLDAHYGISPEDVALLQQRVFPMRPDRGSISGRAILTRALVHIEDVRADPEYRVPVVRTLEGYRTYLSAPLLRKDVVVGVINLWRPQVRPFSQTQVEMAQMFADQAVIAIENVRLFKELEARNRDLSEALEQQTATGEVLKVISRSTFDLQPVLDALVENAARLCGASTGLIWRVDGEVFRLTADYGLSPTAKDFWQRHPHRPGRGSVTGRTALERRPVHIPDVLADPEYQSTEGQRVGGYRTLLGVPMLREGVLIGCFSLERSVAQPFTDKQIELVTTFADQAVIAIENVRLLTELQTRTGELTRSVEQLTALGEVSRAVSSTLRIEAVLDIIVSRASQLAGGAGCSIYEYDEGAERFELRATHHHDGEFVEALRAAPLRRGEGLMGYAAELREPAQIPDITQPGAYDSAVRDTLIRFGYRALLSVPLLREGQIIGSLSFNRSTPGEFPAEVVEVLRTFATQSALAIQNARLFREIEAKSRELEVASQHKSEFLANMSHELRTPLNAIIGLSEVLSERMFGELNEKQDEYLKDIHVSGQHLLSLINDILDLSKIEAGRTELELTDFHLPTALDNALTLVRERAGRRGIALHLGTDDRLDYVRADERKVRQVVLNLLSNAIKFTPEEGRIEVRARPVDGSVEISVTDTGVGIAPEDQEAIFEEFRQVGTADKKVEGTGLGLALSRKFIELHGGRIWVESQLGEGSTFTFTIPAGR
jgi:GAF domain-containing protein